MPSFLKQTADAEAVLVHQTEPFDNNQPETSEQTSTINESIKEEDDS